MTPLYRFVLYRDRQKLWRWRLVARNGKVVADSAESYAKRSHALKMVGQIARWPHEFQERTAGR